MTLQSCFSGIKDNRRAQGKRYQLEHILLFSILALLSNANSYRQIHCFIKEHYKKLNKKFNLNWKRIPSYTTIRSIIQGVSGAELERVFRRYSHAIAGEIKGKTVIAFDGKTLRGSFDHFKDQRAIQILSAFLTEKKIILAHEEIAEKTNEIPTAQELIQELGVENCTFTFDAMNCQKKR